MICGTTYFLPRKGKYNHGNSLHALRHFLATAKWQTINVQFGRGAWKLHLKCQVLLVVDGAWKVRIWPLTREKGYLLLRQSWNFCHVIAKMNVFRTIVLVSRINWSAPTCASWLLVQINHQKMMTIQQISIMTLMTVMIMKMRAMTLKHKTLINFDMHKL